jgi:hypothetical protein
MLKVLAKTHSVISACQLEEKQHAKSAKYAERAEKNAA